jgi:hypothetical protein
VACFSLGAPPSPKTVVTSWRRSGSRVFSTSTVSSQRSIFDCTAELERQAGNNEGREEDRKKTLSGGSEGDGLAVGGAEGLSSAGVSATANLQGVTSRFDWYLDRVVHFERSGTLTVNHDVVRATSDLDSDSFMRQLQRCAHG